MSKVCLTFKYIQTRVKTSRHMQNFNSFSKSHALMPQEWTLFLEFTNLKKYPLLHENGYEHGCTLWSGCVYEGGGRWAPFTVHSYYFTRILFRGGTFPTNFPAFYHFNVITLHSIYYIVFNNTFINTVNKSRLQISNTFTVKFRVMTNWRMWGAITYL